MFREMALRNSPYIFQVVRSLYQRKVVHISGTTYTSWHRQFKIVME
jgi:hypothetical protein